jgi:hypothetical protein
MSEISYLDNHREPKLKPMTGSFTDRQSRIGGVITGAILVVALIGLLALAVITTRSDETPTIGGEHVPSGLRCQEDEIIGFQDNGRLGCVHIDTLWRYGNETDAHPS